LTEQESCTVTFFLMQYLGSSWKSPGILLPVEVVILIYVLTCVHEDFW